MSWWIAAQLLRVALTNIALALHTYDPINVLHYIGMAIYTYALHNDGRYYESCLYTCLPQAALYRTITIQGHEYAGR